MGGLTGRLPNPVRLGHRRAQSAPDLPARPLPFYKHMREPVSHARAKTTSKTTPHKEEEFDREGFHQAEEALTIRTMPESILGMSSPRPSRRKPRRACTSPRKCPVPLQRNSAFLVVLRIFCKKRDTASPKHAGGAPPPRGGTGHLPQLLLLVILEFLHVQVTGGLDPVLVGFDGQGPDC